MILQQPYMNHQAFPCHKVHRLFSSSSLQICSAGHDISKEVDSLVIINYSSRGPLHSLLSAKK